MPVPRKAKDVMPRNARVGHSWRDPATGVWCVWSGKHWHESTPFEIVEKIKEYGSTKSWMVALYPESGK